MFEFADYKWTRLDINEQAIETFVREFNGWFKKFEDEIRLNLDHNELASKCLHEPVVYEEIPPQANKSPLLELAEIDCQNQATIDDLEVDLTDQASQIQFEQSFESQDWIYAQQDHQAVSDRNDF